MLPINKIEAFLNSLCNRWEYVRHPEQHRYWVRQANGTLLLITFGSDWEVSIWDDDEREVSLCEFRRGGWKLEPRWTAILRGGKRDDAGVIVEAGHESV